MAKPTSCDIAPACAEDPGREDWRCHAANLASDLRGGSWMGRCENARPASPRQRGAGVTGDRREDGPTRGGSSFGVAAKAASRRADRPEALTVPTAHRGRAARADPRRGMPPGGPSLCGVAARPVTARAMRPKRSSPHVNAPRPGMSGPGPARPRPMAAPGFAQTALAQAGRRPALRDVRPPLAFRRGRTGHASLRDRGRPSAARGWIEALHRCVTPRRARGLPARRAGGLAGPVESGQPAAASGFGHAGLLGWFRRAGGSIIMPCPDRGP